MPTRRESSGETCRACNGSGTDPHTGDECARCEGSGYEPRDHGSKAKRHSQQHRQQPRS